jgi:hypothetical protein
VRKTILTCDRCKKEVDTLCEVAAGMKQNNYSSYGGRGININSPYFAEWCAPCCAEVGFHKYQPPKTVEEIQPKLEEIIREIIREEIENLK